MFKWRPGASWLDRCLAIASTPVRLAPLLFLIGDFRPMVPWWSHDQGIWHLLIQEGKVSSRSQLTDSELGGQRHEARETTAA